MGGMKNHWITVLEAPVSKVEARRAGVSLSTPDSVRSHPGGQQYPHSVAALPGDESNSAVWRDAATLRWWRRRFAGCLSLGLLASSLAAGVEVNPVLIGTWPGERGSNIFHRAVAVAGQQAFIADQFNGLRVLDISNPAHPEELARYDAPGVTDVVVSGQLVYLAVTGVGLVVVDVADPLHPRRLGGFAAKGLGGHYGDYGPYGSCYWGAATHSFGPELAVSGERAFVLAQVGSGNWPRFGPLILDVADPAAVRQLGVIETFTGRNHEAFITA
jgi:hypothetical protein